MALDYEVIESVLVAPGEDATRIREYALALVRECKAKDAELDAKHAKLVEVADKLREERARTDALVAALNEPRIRGILADRAPDYEILGRVRIALEAILAERRTRAKRDG